MALTPPAARVVALGRAFLLPSRLNTVESRSSEKPALGQASRRSSQRQSGRQKASM